MCAYFGFPRSTSPLSSISNARRHLLSLCARTVGPTPNVTTLLYLYTIGFRHSTLPPLYICAYCRFPYARRHFLSRYVQHCRFPTLDITAPMYVRIVGFHTRRPLLHLFVRIFAYFRFPTPDITFSPNMCNTVGVICSTTPGGVSTSISCRR